MVEKLRFCKGDWLAVAAVILLAVGVFLCFFSPEQATATHGQIYLEGELIQTLSLEQDQVLTVTRRYTNEITVSGGKISITGSDCPGQDCVHSGSIHSAGRSLVCLPNGLEIRVTAQEGDVDFVVG